MSNTVSTWDKIKKWLIICVIIVIICFLARSCYNNIKETRNENLRQWKEDSIRNSKIILEDIDFEKEKAVLSSISLGLQPDTSILIIKDYIKLYNSNDGLEYVYPDDKNINVDSLIKIISHKYKVNKRKIATLIYVYKHGTIIKYEGKPDVESEDDNEY